MTPLAIPPQLVRGRVFHKRRGVPYAHGCNGEAIRDAGRGRKWDGIDLDIQPDAAGVAWVCHQLHPTRRDAWFDPAGKIRDAHRIDKLRTVDVRRLRVTYQGRRRPILTAYGAAQICGRVGLVPCFEAKGLNPRFFDPEWWTRFRANMPPGVVPVIMSLPGTRGGQSGLGKLAAAHEAGLPTMWLWRGTPPAGFERYVDLVKSRPRHPIHRV